MSVDCSRYLTPHACGSPGKRTNAADADADFLPRRKHRLLLGALLAEVLARLQVGRIGELLEIGRGPRCQERVVPDASRRVPGVAADPDRGEIEGLVRDTRVDVHAAIVAF